MAELPFEFFENYFKNHFENDYKSFIKHCTEEYASYPEFKITEEYCEYYNPHSFNDDGPEPGLEKIYFIPNSKYGLKKEIERTKSIVEQECLKRLGDRSQLSEYQKYLKKRILSILEIDTIKNLAIAKIILSPIESRMAELFKELNPSIKVGHSFNISSTNRDSNEILKELHSQLVEHSIIEGSLEEFIKAFTGIPTDGRIKWLVKGKNGDTSKISLFYFINKLSAKNLLSGEQAAYPNKFVKSVFRDSDGNHFNNVRQSKSTMSSRPAMSDTIDNILSSLSI